jgi:hypothetical protein
MSDAISATDLTVPRAFERRRRTAEDPAIDSALTWIAARLSVAAAPVRSRGARSLGDAAAARSQAFAALSTAALAELRLRAAVALRSGRMNDANIVEALAIAREYTRRTLRLDPYPQQVACASALIRGCVAEMATGEGKTIAALLAAAVYGLAGRSVHIVTSNDYLANRDAEQPMSYMFPARRFVSTICGTVWLKHSSPANLPLLPSLDGFSVRPHVTTHSPCNAHWMSQLSTK